MKDSKSLQPRIFLKQKIALVLFGLFLFFVILEAGLRLCGFILLSIQEYKNLQSIKQKGAYRIVCLGESTTMDGYPACLEKSLNKRSMGIIFSVINCGVSGIDSSIIVNGLEDNLNKYSPDLVVTMMGINDGGLSISSEQQPISKANLFVTYFRTYKLAQLIFLHISKKAEETGFVKSKLNNWKVKKSGLNLETPDLNGARDEVLTLEESKDFFVKDTARVSNSASSYIRSGKFYANRGYIPKAKELFQKAIEMEPDNLDAYYMLAWLHKDQKEYAQSEECYKKILLIDPGSIGAYYELGDNYRVLGKFSQSAELFKKALDLDPENAETYFKLGNLYRDQKDTLRAGEAFRTCLRLNSSYDKAYGALMTLYEEAGQYESAEEYRKKLEELLFIRLNPATRYNYLKLKEILERKGIGLVCVQYPMRSIAPLKKIFHGIKEDVIFVDNQALFRQAVRQEGFTEYFVDSFGGDFGHFTEKGDKLLAENIANVILKEIFNK